MAGYYWYGAKRKGPGRPPKWVQTALSDLDSNSDKRLELNAAAMAKSSDSSTSNARGDGAGLSPSTYSGVDSPEVRTDYPGPLEDSGTAAIDLETSPDQEETTTTIAPVEEDTNSIETTDAETRGVDDRRRRPTRYSLRVDRRPPNRLK